MIRYEVTLECLYDTAPALMRWMRNIHIPDMRATGCFTGIHFDSAEGRFRTVYQAEAKPQLDRYLAEHAEKMRGDWQRQFSGGVAVSRDVWGQSQSGTPTLARDASSTRRPARRPAWR